MKYLKNREEIQAMEFILDEHTLPVLQVFTENAIFRTGHRHTPAGGPWAYVKSGDEKHPTFVILEGEYIAKRADGILFVLTREQLESLYSPL
ncbi:hypothetical protein UFOVP116_201 [uncultured Caudovirales phage]|uniref:Uncharacterized protein n=1 Tax=uncultured Caudovirales phage TaxID=2100421 RepID=A0A6J5L9G5_9CAUD|nr:hypothetical protein UFOVP116_201 [uncultured Caudovirales phage]